MSNVPLLQCLLTTLIKNPQTQVKENKPIAMSKKKNKPKKKTEPMLAPN